jgi:hypothetical protein
MADDPPTNNNPYAPGRTDVDVFGKPTNPTGDRAKQDPAKTPKWDPNKPIPKASPTPAPTPPPSLAEIARKSQIQRQALASPAPNK